MKESKRLNQNGQVMVEFIMTFGVILGVLVGGTFLLKKEWQRFKCAYRAFEKTHARLVGSPPEFFSTTTSIVEDDQGVEGTVRCGKIVERIRMDRIESRSKW